ncbi:MAG: EF-Tu/IF-2/RF-3 family GTPase [Methanobacteriota archaeon]
MTGMTVAVVGDALFAADLGKKGTVSDISFYNLKRGDVGITYVEPSRYPERIQSLLTALAMADSVVLVIEKLDRLVGEAIVAIDSVGVPRGHIILKNFVQPEEIAPYIKGTVLESYTQEEPDTNKMNDRHVNAVLPPCDGPVKIPVDHHFNVKGVGVVILGCVKRGQVKLHDELQIYPTEKTAMVRSIQVHDTDVKQAVLGNRVGLAVKNAEVEDFDRGYVLAPKGSLSSADELSVDFAASKFWKGEIAKDSIVHVAVGLQIRPGKAVAVDGGSLKPGATAALKLKLDKPVAYEKGDRAIVLDLDSKGLRIVGRGTLA